MMRSFVNFFFAAALASAVAAQDVFIAEPEAHSRVAVGSSITIEIDKPNSLTGSQDVAIVIGLVPCISGFCPDVNERLGEILYSGPYDPEPHDRTGNPYQNFTVTVPSGYSGLVQLGVAHFFLLNAGPSPQLQVTSTTLDVVA